MKYILSSKKAKSEYFWSCARGVLTWGNLWRPPRWALQPSPEWGRHSWGGSPAGCPGWEKTGSWEAPVCVLRGGANPESRGLKGVLLNTIFNSPQNNLNKFEPPHKPEESFEVGHLKQRRWDDRPPLHSRLKYWLTFSWNNVNKLSQKDCRQHVLLHILLNSIKNT